MHAKNAPNVAAAAADDGGGSAVYSPQLLIIEVQFNLMN